MLTLRVMSAHEGDCLLLIHGDGTRHLLIDGGPRHTFAPQLQRTLAALAPQQLEAVCLSHVDTDHTTGLMELFALLRDERDDGEQPLVSVGGFWLNEFDDTLGAGGAGRRLRDRFEDVLAGLGPQGQEMALASADLTGIQHGHELVLIAKQLDIPINVPTGGKPFVAGKVDPLHFGDLTLRVVGPTEANLEALRTAWDAWLAKQEGRIARGKLRLAAMADRSIPNLSSIQLLAEAGGKRILFTGDGRGDHLLDALEEAELLDDDGGIDVDVLKCPHHGSDRNVDLEFFERVRADTYVISADGKHGNPDRATLEWIYKAAKTQGRRYELVLTNLPDDAAAFKQARPPDEVYSLRVRGDDEDYVDVTP